MGASGGSAMTRYRSPLARMLPETMDVERIKRDGYRQDGILVIDMHNDRMDPIERELFRQWAEKRYPKPKNEQQGPKR